MRLYRALLRVYPTSFRNEYGREMAAIFARRYQKSGFGGRVVLCLQAAGDVARNAPPLHWDILRQDLQSAARTATRGPLFSVTVMIVAALGIGATTAAFSLADHVLLRPLPFRDPGRLVKLWQDPGFRGGRLELSPANYRDWKAQATAFVGMAAFTSFSANLIGQGEPIRLEGARIDGDLFAVLGTQPALGRLITADDDREGAPSAVVLGNRLWRTRFGGDARLVGSTIRLNDTPHVVVGIAPAGFEFPERTVDFWVPFQFGPREMEDRSNVYLQVVGRLKEGVAIDQAQGQMRVIARQIEQQFPKSNTRVGARVIGLRDEIPQQSRLLLLGLVAASVAVLLIACTNLANLLLTKALERQRELAVRAALGAGRDRLVRQILTETLLLAGIGGIVGVGLAVAVVPFVARLVPMTLPIAESPSLDWRLLSAAAVTTLATAVGFGVIPALRVGRHADASALRDGPRTGTGRRTERLRSTLVVAEVTISVVLLVCTGLLVRALWRVQEVNPGFTPEGVLTLRTALPFPKYGVTAQRHQFYDRVLEDVRALPGVSQAAYISFLPMVMRAGIWAVTVDGKPDDPSARKIASLRLVTPGVFATLGIPLLRGRDISDADGPGAPDAAVVSESFVREHWPGQDPIGRRVRVALRDRLVVGVVGDIRVRGLERSSEPQLYLSSRQVPDGNLLFYAPKDLVVRSSVASESLVPAITQIIARADPQQPVSDVQTLTDIVAADTGPRSVQVRVIGAFAAIAFLLAGIGLHGVLAFNVSCRARDIGVRIALGAENTTILRMIMREGALLAALGIVIGSGLAWAAGRSMQALLFGVSPTDATTFSAAVTLVLLMSLAGSLLPALRAIRVDPISVIRTE